MAAFDQGGGCACGLYRDCRPECEHNPANRLSTWPASHALMAMLRLSRRERREVLARMEVLHAPAVPE